MRAGMILEIDTVAGVGELAQRVLGGQIVVVRRALQQVGLYDTLVDASLKGIRQAAGDDVAAHVRRAGFDRIHEWVPAAQLAAVTDAVYDVMTPMAGRVLSRLIPCIFPHGGNYYFERSPNIRFHIPYDLAAPRQREFDEFARRRGEGKITAHGPHRDPWVDCPDNAINIWIGLGPVRRGNGLTIFADDYRNQFAFEAGYIAGASTLHPPVTFELEPGDAVVFHGQHVHGSELNWTDRTRYVVSFRITFGRPHYPHGHYHHYVHGRLATGPARWLAGLPQNLQPSFFRFQLRRLRDKMTGRGKMTGMDGPAAQPMATVTRPTDTAGGSIPLAGFAIGSIRAVSASVCVARLGADQFAAVDRRCPHRGGDLTGGWIDDGKLVCPLHSLPFDPWTGASPCRSLRPLRRFAWEVRDERVHVDLAGGERPTADTTPAT